MPFWFIPAAFAAKWAFARFAQHGGDTEATREALAQDLTQALKTAITVAKKGADISVDTARISTAIISVRNAGDFQSLVDANHALERALAHIPPETLAGLKKSISLDDKIDAALAAGMMYSASTMLEKAPDGSESGETILMRIYFGLYLVGKAGEKIDPDHSASCIANLIEIHKQTNPDNPEVVHALNAIIAGESHQHMDEYNSFITLTQHIPEALQQDTATYVLAGLGVPSGTPEQSLHEDLLHFQETR